MLYTWLEWIRKEKFVNTSEETSLPGSLYQSISQHFQARFVFLRALVVVMEAHQDILKEVAASFMLMYCTTALSLVLHQQFVMLILTSRIGSVFNILLCYEIILRKKNVFIKNKKWNIQWTYLDTVVKEPSSKVTAFNLLQYDVMSFHHQALGMIWHCSHQILSSSVRLNGDHWWTFLGL